MNKAELALCKKALYEVEMMEVSGFDSLPQEEREHSSEFSKKIKSLIEKTRKKESSFVLMNYKKIIIVALTVTLIALTCIACRFAPQIKAFFVEHFEKYTSLTVEGNESVLSEVYKLGIVYEGFCLVNEYRDQYFSKFVYENGDESISITQGIISTNATTIDTEENEYSICNIGDNLIYKTKRNDYYVMAWIFDDCIFSFSCPTSIPWSEVEKMILSIEPETK